MQEKKIEVLKTLPMPKIDQETILGFLKRDYERAKDSGALDVAARIRKEKTGGPCEKCGRPWKKVEVRHSYADYMYFDPDCNCFPRCPECGVSWHRVATPGSFATDYTRCPSCSWRRDAAVGLLCPKCKRGFLHEGRKIGDEMILCPDCSGKKSRSSVPVPYSDFGDE